MKNVRWFFAEFMVVVSGILVAFFLNSWWIGIENNKKQERYLNQVEAEIAETISLISKAKEYQTERFKSLVVLLRAVYTIPEALPADSILANSALSGMSFDTGGQVSATLRSLVSTGDLQLIEDDSLRALLVLGIEELINYDKQMNNQTFQWGIPAYDAFVSEFGIFDFYFSQIDTAGMREASVDSLKAIPLPEHFKRPEKINWPQLLNKPSFKQALEKLYFVHNSMRHTHINTERKMKELEENFIRIRNR